MSDNVISVFNQSVQEAGIWINEICDEMGDPRKHIAYQALRGVLFAVRDRLPISEAVQLAAQLPLLIRGIFFEGYRPAGKPDKLDKDEFLARVSKKLQSAGGAHPEKAARAVLAVLQRHVDEGEMEDVRNALPKELRSLWPQPLIPAGSL
jgi:uncharacterized protein (DUF2267 family)